MIWKKRCFWAVICPMMYILVLLAVVPFVYGIVDDRTMMEVISGRDSTVQCGTWTGMRLDTFFCRYAVWD